MSRLALFLIPILSLQLAAPSAFACGPFDYQIYKETLAMRSGASSRAVRTEVVPAPPLAWATAVTRDATTIHSDSGFFTHSGGDGSWSYDPGDSGLAKGNTLIEFYGYFSKLLGGDKPQPQTDDLLRTAIFDPKNAGKFEGISINTLRSYPDVNFQMVAGALMAIFPKDYSRILSEMQNQNKNRKEYGMKFWTRPAYLDSEASPGIAAPCMAIAYGQDYFTNAHIAEELAELNKTKSPPMTEMEYRNEHLTQAFGIALRSSIVDYAAAQAFKQLDPETGKLANTSFKIGGKVECSLVTAEGYRLGMLRTRCGQGPNEKFYQSNPVVREVDGGLRRMVQVGMNLFQVDCKDSAGTTIRVSDADVSWEQGKILFSDMMKLGGTDKTPEAVTKDVAAAAAILVSIPPADFEAAKKTVIQASATCTSYLEQTALKKGVVTGTPGDARPAARPGS